MASYVSNGTVYSRLYVLVPGTGTVVQYLYDTVTARQPAL